LLFLLNCLNLTPGTFPEDQVSNIAFGGKNLYDTSL